MIYLAVGMVILIIFTVGCFIISDDYEIMSAVGILSSIILLVFIIVFIICGYNWAASSEKADIINREYKTNYTAREIFYASDIIETIQQIKRQRIEINGDIMRENKK